MSGQFPKSYSHDALGRLTNMVDAVGTTKYTYASGLLATEDGPWANDTVAWDYNTARKRSALRLQQTSTSWWTDSYAWDASHRLVDWYPTSTERFVYDGMLLVQERNTSAPTVSYTRGVDLSGSLDGAGGIGGLLARSHGFSTGSGTWSTHSAYHADGNGNVTGLYSTSTGSQVGWCRYDAFGRLLQSSGTLASANRMRFSSKPWMAPGVDASAGLYYYGYRFYDPNTQRWVNRDPIGETDTINLYAFVKNAPIVRIDDLGLGSIIVDSSCLGHEDLLKGMTYYAESEPPDDGPKIHRRLPMPDRSDRSVDADAIYWGNGTATKIPDFRWVVIRCVCKDGEWSTMVQRGGPPLRPFIDWKRGDPEPPGWPGRGQPENPPHNGTLPRPPLPPLDPGYGTVDGIFR